MDLLQLSVSNVQHLMCPAGFRKLRELGEWPSPISTAAVQASNRGRAIHAALAVLYKGGPLTPDLSRLDYALAAGVSQFRAKAECREAARAELRSLICTYLAADLTPSVTLGTEEPHRVRLMIDGEPAAILSAQHDRVQVPRNDNQCLEVVDIATGQKDVHPWAGYLSLRVAAARWPGFKRHRLCIHRLTLDRLEVEVFDAASFRGVAADLVAAVKEYQSFREQGNFAFRTGEGCHYCQLRRHGLCPEHREMDVEGLEEFAD